MQTTSNNLMTLKGIFVMSLITANVCSSKIVDIFGLTVPAAVVAYPLTFLMTDVIGELYGREEADSTVRLGFLCQLLSSALIFMALRLPEASFSDNQAAFAATLGNTFRIFAASMTAYIISQSVDVRIFHHLREKWTETHEDESAGRWIRNNVSTMTSQLIDTVIFIVIAFYGVVPNLLTMILSQYVIKLAYALLDTPFFYLLTSRRQGRVS